MKTELLIGAGSARDKRLKVDDHNHFQNVTTLDYNHDHHPDVVHDLMIFPYPFDDNSFDEIHAYEVLEHTGQQGDWRFFFRQFSELWRILKPDGHLLATCPSIRSRWAWGDPSHTRVLVPEQMTFLNQSEYERQIGKTQMSDFRFCYTADFVPIHLEESDDTFIFILQAKK